MELSSLSVLLMLSICSFFSEAQAVTTVVLRPPSPPQPIVRGTFTISCTAERTSDGATVQNFKWYHNQTEITDEVIRQRNGRFSIRRVGNVSSTLTVTSTERRDGGEYYCQVFISGSTNPINSLRQNIQIEGIYSVTTDQYVYEAVLNSSFAMRCIVDANPPPSTITWRRKGSLYLIQHSYDPFFGTLQKTATLEDDGDWSCSASSTSGGLGDEFTVIILVPPSNTMIAPHSGPIQRGHDLKLACTASGKPAPNITWTFNETTNLNELSRISNSRYLTGWQNLTVNRTTYRDAGTYTCTATNKAGTDSTSVNIEIQGAPEILVEQSTSPIRIGIYSGISLSCPFISNPPATSVQWKRGTTPIQPGDQYQISLNSDTLNVSSFNSTGAVAFTCNVNNDHGNDTRTFNLLIQDIPAPPTDFNFEVDPDDSRSITVRWTESVQTGPIDEVDEYVVEKSRIGGQFKVTDYVFRGNATSGVLLDLLPGETCVYRLRARNVAGLSRPSNTLTYTPPATSPMLSYFNASALDGGRSVLLQWELAFTGGHGITEFRVEITPPLIIDTETIDHLALNVDLGRYVLTGLNHDTHYQFKAVLVNAAGRTANFSDETNTTIAPPSQPSRPTIALKTTGSIRITFSVEFGTKPITHFLLNITETKSGAEVQKRFPVDAVKYIDSLEDIVSSEGTVIGYRVVMVVTGLKEREVYQFQVAAESSIGVGEFSESSDNAKLEDDRILYFIIGAVFGGVLSIVIPIAVMALFCYGKQRYSQRKKTITINSNGSHAFSASEDIDNAFTKATTPSVRHHSRETLTSTTNSYFSNGHIHPSITKQESFDKEKVMTSTPYNRLGESPLPSAVSIGIKTDSVIDMPAENGTVVQTYFAGGKVAYNPQYNHHVPAAQYSPRPQHMQLQLQTSLNDLQRQVETPSPPDRYTETPMSERPFLSHSHNMLCVPGATNLSRSNPTISNRHSCDSMLVPPGPTSQATDV